MTDGVEGCTNFEDGFETGKRRSNFQHIDEVTAVLELKEGRIIGISLVEDDGGATGFIHNNTQELLTSHSDMQNYPHKFDRRIYTEKECKCGRDESDVIHGIQSEPPNADKDHPFDRRAFSPLCKCGKPLWEAVHDVYKFEQESNDE